MKRVALELAEMEAFLRKREAEEEHIQQEIQDAFRELNKSVTEPAAWANWLASVASLEGEGHDLALFPATQVALLRLAWPGIKARHD